MIKAHFAYIEPLAEHKPGTLIFSLSNDGPFIPEGQIGRVFDRFFSANNNGEPKGYGIGLSFCRDIIEAHNGDIQMENLASGGVIVAVELPC